MRQQAKLAQTDQSGIFLFLWTCVNLFDLIASSETILHIQRGAPYYAAPFAFSILASLSYLVLNLTPYQARVAILTASITQVFNVLVISPEIPNHRLVAALINITLVADILKTQSLTLTDRFIETAKILVSTVYTFSFLHKLNTDFVDPIYSCSTKFAYDLGQYYPTLKFLQSYKGLIPLASIIVEGLLATIYFLPRQLIILVITVGFVFHSLLAIHIERHFFDFSALMMTLLLLYIRCRKPVSLPPRLIRWFMAVGFIGVYLLLLNPDSYLSFIAVVQIRTRLWLIFSILIAFYACKFAFDKRMEPTSQVRIKKLHLEMGKLNLFIIIFAILNGLTPYLGLKTRYAFDMYSNLRVEAQESNHLFIPSSLQLRLFTDDLVELIEVENMEKFYPFVRPEVLAAGKRIVRFQLMSSMAKAPGLIATIRDEQGERKITKASQVYQNGWVAPWIMRKMIGFRPVGSGGVRETCQW